MTVPSLYLLDFSIDDIPSIGWSSRFISLTHLAALELPSYLYSSTVNWVKQINWFPSGVNRLRNVRQKHSLSNIIIYNIYRLISQPFANYQTRYTNKDMNHRSNCLNMFLGKELIGVSIRVTVPDRGKFCENVVISRRWPSWRCRNLYTNECFLYLFFLQKFFNNLLTSSSDFGSDFRIISLSTIYLNITLRYCGCHCNIWYRLLLHNKYEAKILQNRLLQCDCIDV